MTNGYNDKRRGTQRRFREPSYLLGNAREPFQFFRVRNRRIETGVGGVVEEGRADDLTPVSEVEDEPSLDIRDLLLDESD